MTGVPAGGGYPGLITPFGGTLEGGGTFSQGFPEGESTASWKMIKYPPSTLINISLYKWVLECYVVRGFRVPESQYPVGKYPQG